jgi:hypothetical protein
MELTMGGKSDLSTREDRPESGGADKDMMREKSGILERDREKYAIEQQARREVSHRDHPVHHAPFSIDNPPNPEPREKKK